MAVIGEPAKVVLQFPDGSVYDLTGHVVNLTIENGLQENVTYEGLEYYVPRGPMSFSLEVVGHDLSILEPHDWERKVDKLRKAREWRCPYCDHVNPIEARNCGEMDRRTLGCGAARPFIYD